MSLVCKECGDEIEIKKYDKGMSCFTCKYHIKKNDKSYCEDAFGFEVNLIKTIKYELNAELKNE